MASFGAEVHVADGRHQPGPHERHGAVERGAGGLTAARAAFRFQGSPLLRPRGVRDPGLNQGGSGEPPPGHPLNVTGSFPTDVFR